jgi:hypothetical protein
MAHPPCTTDAHAEMNGQVSGLVTSTDASVPSIDQALLRRLIGCSRSVRMRGASPVREAPLVASPGRRGDTGGRRRRDLDGRSAT